MPISPKAMSPVDPVDPDELSLSDEQRLLVEMLDAFSLETCPPCYGDGAVLGQAGCHFDYRAPLLAARDPEATLYRLEAEWTAARLLTLEAVWMSDNRRPNSKEASIAKAGREPTSSP